MSMHSLIERISQLTKTIEESAANHNALIGRLAEAKTILDMLNSVKLPGTVGEVIGAVDTAANAVENALDGSSEPK